MKKLSNSKKYERSCSNIAVLAFVFHNCTSNTKNSFKTFVTNVKNIACTTAL